MKIKYTVLVAVLVTMAFAACRNNPGRNPVIPVTPLSKQQANELAANLWHEKQKVTEALYGPMWDAQLFELRDLRMPVFTAIYGEKPDDGRSLYISMHGGGNAATTINDEQWQNQKMLYTPKEGVYIAPRAAVNDWNMWFRPFVDTLFQMIIRTAVIKHDVNPNKVYIMGYSAGGDGAYRMAARMADHWAAAAMMAGTVGETSPLNLRNIGFTIWMGENDSAYHRNELAVEFGHSLDSLHAVDPGGYIHQTNIVADKGHWMDNADTLAVKWMSVFRRNPYPDRIVWRQEESALRQNFYYLSIPPDEAKAGKEVRVDKSGNTITILKNDYSTLYIDLNDKIVDLDKPVTVICNGEKIFKGMVKREAEHIAISIEERNDQDYIFSALIKLEK